MSAATAAMAALSKLSRHTPVTVPLLIANYHKSDSAPLLSPPLSTIGKLAIVIASFAAHQLLYSSIPARTLLSPDDCKLLDKSRYKPNSSEGKALQQKQSTIRNYIVSTFHSVVAIGAVVWFFSTYQHGLHSVDRTFAGGVIGTGDEYQQYFLSWSIGYFFWDLICMATHKGLGSTGSYIHHALMILAFGSALLLNNMSPFHFYLLFEEFSTPALNLKTLFKQYPRASDAFALLFALTFFLCRILYGSWIFAMGIQHLPSYFRQCLDDGRTGIAAHVVLQLFLFSATRLLNFYWMYLIARKVMKSLSGKPSKRKRKQSLGEALTVDTQELDRQLSRDYESLMGSSQTNGKTNGHSTPSSRRTRKDA